MTHYKVLGPNGESIHGGDLKWSLPTKKGRTWEPGEWHSVEDKVYVCRNGLHLTTEPWQHWVRWNSVVYVAEGSGDSQTDGDKTVYQKARLLRPARVPTWWSGAHGFVASIRDVDWLRPDGRPLKKWKFFDTRDAAWNAARDAVGAAAGDAAGAAAGDAAGDAARAAARDAAWNAARAAVWDVAWAAVRDVAWAAAWDVAWDASLCAQCVHICDGTDLAANHIKHAKARWQVWEKGYGLAADVEGMLYVYRSIA